MGSLVACPVDFQMTVLKDLNVLLLRGNHEDGNGMKMASAGQGKWSAWVTPVVMDIPAELSKRTAEQSERLKYTMNLFFQLIMVYFKKTAVLAFMRSNDIAEDGGDIFGGGSVGGGDVIRRDGGEGMEKRTSAPAWLEQSDHTIRSQINHVLDQLDAQTGWSVSSVKFARNILGGIISKVLTASIMVWKNDFERGEWYAVFDLATAIQDFMFYRPLARDVVEAWKVNADGTTEEPILSNAPPHHTPPMKFRRSRKHFGIHMRKSVPEDMNLAKSFVTLMNKLGMRNGEPAPEDMTSSKARHTWQHAMWLLTAFEDFVDLFKVIENEGIESQSVEGMLEKVGNLLEQSKHADPSGSNAPIGSILHIVKRKVMQRVKKGNTLAGRLHKQLCTQRQRAETIAEEQVQAFMSTAAPILELDLKDDDGLGYRGDLDDANPNASMIHMQVAGTGVACQQISISADNPLDIAGEKPGGEEGPPGSLLRCNADYCPLFTTTDFHLVYFRRQPNPKTLVLNLALAPP